MLLLDGTNLEDAALLPEQAGLIFEFVAKTDGGISLRIIISSEVRF